MQGVTLAVALLASGAILVAPPRYALPFFLGAVAWYPSDLAVSLGTVDFTVGRIVVLALLAKAVLGSTERRMVSWGWVDLCVAGGVVGQCLAGALVTPDLGSLLENRAGAAFDTALPYFAARLLLQRREEYILLLKSLLVIALPLALLGAYQCLTGQNPIGFLSRFSYYGASLADRVLPARKGLWRAEATFGVSIMFGLFFAMVGPLCAGLWGYAKRRARLLVGLVLMAVGMLSSMSSGPWLAGIVACGVMGLYPFRQYWKVLTALLIIWLMAINIGSNRHWYDVLGSYCTLEPETASYRIRLMEVALGGGMSGHWLAGYGPFADPGWGPIMDGRGHTDIVNHYVLIVVTHGLLGLLPFLGAVGGSLIALRRAFKLAGSQAERWLLWGMFSALAGILVAILSVSLMCQVTTLFFVLLALCVSAGAEGFLRTSPVPLVLRTGRFAHRARMST